MGVSRPEEVRVDNNRIINWLGKAAIVLVSVVLIERYDGDEVADSFCLLLDLHAYADAYAYAMSMVLGINMGTGGGKYKSGSLVCWRRGSELWPVGLGPFLYFRRLQACQCLSMATGDTLDVTLADTLVLFNIVARVGNRSTFWGPFISFVISSPFLIL